MSSGGGAEVCGPEAMCGPVVGADREITLPWAHFGDGGEGAVADVEDAVIAQVTTPLARAIRTPDSNLRRRRLTIAGALAVFCVVATTIFVLDVRGEEHWGGKVVVYNLIFFVTLIGAIAYLIVGLLTPKADEHLPSPLP